MYGTFGSIFQSADHFVYGEVNFYFRFRQTCRSSDKAFKIRIMLLKYINPHEMSFCHLTFTLTSLHPHTQKAQLNFKPTITLCWPRNKTREVTLFSMPIHVSSHQSVKNWAILHYKVFLNQIASFWA